MDIQMPIMDGYEATREIRKSSREDLAEIPIIAMTANAFDEYKQNAYEAGMSGHMSKPITQEKLLDTLGKYI
jgi:CheY-like chemotaxis protein